MTSASTRIDNFRRFNAADLRVIVAALNSASVTNPVAAELYYAASAALDSKRSS